MINFVAYRGRATIGTAPPKKTGDRILSNPIDFVEDFTPSQFKAYDNM